MHLLFEGLRIQRTTIRALLSRDLAMRYGRTNIGFVWAIIEPMLLCLGVMAVWSAMGAEKNGLRIAEIVFTGYMPLTLWRHTTNNSIQLFRNQSALLYHRRITLWDLFYARMGLEFITATSATIVIWTALNTFGVLSSIARLDLFILGWLMMGWFGIASAACVAALTERSETIERFIQPIQYLNIPLSGSFFMVDWLPQWAQPLILLHPHASCYEMFRAGYFGDSVVTHYDIPYFVAAAFMMTFIGILAIRHVRHKVQVR